MEKRKQIDGHESKVAVVGAGVFGTALAASALAGGNHVTLFDISEKKLSELASDESLTNCKLVHMSESVRGLAGFDLIILAPPSQHLRSACKWILDRLSDEFGDVSKAPKMWLLSAAKGIEQKTLLLPHQILAQLFPAGTAIGALSGPSFAKELRAGLPTAVVVASADAELRRRANELLHRSFFRVYESQDVVGVEVGGALKNVIAMVAGAADGLRLGNNARAAVITRGLGEIAQVGVKLGADPLTFLGLSGLGDLILTCTGDLSRNRQFGMRLAAGESKDSIISSMGQVIEGVTTAQSASELSQKLGLDTPILKVAHAVLYQDQPLVAAIYSLVNRGQKGEFDWVKEKPL